MKNSIERIGVPTLISSLEEATRSMGFAMASDHETGSLLRTLASTKPGGSILELGTGTGLGACWLLDGMDDRAVLDTVDEDPRVVEIARHHLGHDRRIRFHVVDAALFLREHAGHRYDLVFADAWPGKYSHLDEGLSLLAEGGLYVMDDMAPQDHWPEEHHAKAERLVRELEGRKDLWITQLGWSTGLILITRRRR